MAHSVSSSLSWLTMGFLALGAVVACNEHDPSEPNPGENTAGTGDDGAGGASGGTQSKGTGGSVGGFTTVTSGGSGPSTGSGGTTEPVQDFKGTPRAGDSAPPSSAGGPSGTVTSVSSMTPGYTMVSITYPPEWECPADAAGSPGSSSSSGVGGMGGAGATELAPVDCAELAALRRPALKADALNQLNSVRASVISTKCQTRYETRCVDANGFRADYTKCYGKSWGSGGASSIGMPTAQPGTNNTSGSQDADSGSKGATDYSTTNTQVADVDEADFVKNDGNTIFVLSDDGLHVIDAWPAAQTHEVAHLQIPGEPRRLFLEDGKLVVYARIQASSGQGAGSSNPSDQGCTYGYGCRFTSEGGHTLAVVYDVTTPAEPKELMRYEMSGGFVAARRVDSFVYTVVHDTGAPQIPGLDYTLQATNYEELLAAYEARRAANEALIDGENEAYFLPWMQMTTPDGKSSLTSSCGHALVSSTAHGMSFVSVTSFDLSSLGPPARTLIAANPGYVYASPEALYLAVDQAPEPTTVSGYTSYSYNTTNSVIHKFALQGLETAYRGSAGLPGHILNQFAMDETDSVLRVASTAGWVPDPNVISYITTFQEGTGTLKQIGQLGGIAPTEDIRSVRFDGDRGFVVTFKKTDPLFVFDLADPRKPQMLGELKIPGFSTYMQRLDENHLMAIGFEADDQGSFAYFNGIQIQIFDVSDLSNPTLMYKHVIGTRGSGSEALTNHLAFNYFASRKMLALPITVCEGGGNGVYADKLTFAGVMAFDISLETGIKEHGRLPFVDPSTVGTSECGKWWTDSKSLVKRSIFMEDWIYGLSDAQLRVAPLSDMSDPIATVQVTGQ